MSMAPDDPFDDIVAGLDLPSVEDVGSDTVNVQLLSTEELADMLADMDAKLEDTGQLMFDRNDEAREMHSLRAALRIELARRTK